MYLVSGKGSILKGLNLRIFGTQKSAALRCASRRNGGMTSQSRLRFGVG